MGEHPRMVSHGGRNTSSDGGGVIHGTERGVG